MTGNPYAGCGRRCLVFPRTTLRGMGCEFLKQRRSTLRNKLDASLQEITVVVK